jgi:hypothetical protein
MMSKSKGKNGSGESGYLFLRLVATVFVESFKNLKKTTHIAIKKNGNGEKAISVRVED